MFYTRVAAAPARIKLGSLSKVVSRLSLKHKAIGGATFSYLLKIIPTGSYPPAMSSTQQGALVDPGVANTDLVDVHYKNVRTGVDVAKGTAITNATTEDTWEITGDGQDVWIEVTALAVGQLDLFVNAVSG